MWIIGGGLSTLTDRLMCRPPDLWSWTGAPSPGWGSRTPISGSHFDPIVLGYIEYWTWTSYRMWCMRGLVACSDVDLIYRFASGFRQGRADLAVSTYCAPEELIDCHSKETPVQCIVHGKKQRPEDRRMTVTAQGFWEGGGILTNMQTAGILFSTLSDNGNRIL